MRLIDADILSEVLMEELGKRSMQGFGKGLLLANSCVIHALTIEPERKKGKWFWGDGMYSCDQCHAAFYETSPFCPMCGADMRGEQE